MKRASLVAILAVMSLTGCVSLVAPAYSPQYETIDRIKKIEIEKISLGEFQPRDSQASVNRISLRGSSLTSSNGSFAAYLEGAIRSDLVEMKLYDPSSTVRIDATLLKNEIDVSGISTGTGAIEVKITISRSGVVTFEKTYLATTQFESSFAGAVAIPRGQVEYPNLVRAFLRKLYGDNAFIDAIKVERGTNK